MFGCGGSNSKARRLASGVIVITLLGWPALSQDVPPSDQLYIEDASTDGETSADNQIEGTGNAGNINQPTFEESPLAEETVNVPEATPIIGEYDSNTERELARSDLAAQERMAKAAEWAVVVAIGATVVTLVGVVLVGWTLYHTRRAADAAGKMVTESERATAAVIADQRAWLSIEDVKLKHPTKITEQGIIFGTLVTTKNYGRTPAKSVEIRLESRFDEGNPESFRVAETRFKEMLRNHPAELGTLLFPQETFMQGDTWADGEDKIGTAMKARPNGEIKVGFTIFVGISYRVMGDESVHITYQPYSALNVPVGTEIPQGKTIALQPMPFLAGEAN